MMAEILLEENGSHIIRDKKVSLSRCFYIYLFKGRTKKEMVSIFKGRR